MKIHAFLHALSLAIILFLWATRAEKTHPSGKTSAASQQAGAAPRAPEIHTAAHSKMPNSKSPGVKPGPSIQEMKNAYLESYRHHWISLNNPKNQLLRRHLRGMSAEDWNRYQCLWTAMKDLGLAAGISEDESICLLGRLAGEGEEERLKQMLASSDPARQELIRQMLALLQEKKSFDLRYPEPDEYLARELSSLPIDVTDVDMISEPLLAFSRSYSAVKRHPADAAAIQEWQAQGRTLTAAVAKMAPGRLVFREWLESDKFPWDERVPEIIYNLEWALRPPPPPPPEQEQEQEPEQEL